MADLKKIKTNISGQVVNIDIGGSGGVVAVVVETAAATVAKTATVSGYTPKVGDLLAVTFTLGTSAASPTLDINGTGAKNIRLGIVNASATTFTIGAGGTALLFFDGTYYQMAGSYRTSDSDNFDRTYHNVAKEMGEALYRYKIILEGVDGKYYPLTVTNQSSATLVTKVPTQAILRIGGYIYYYNTTATVNAGATVTNTYSELSQTTMVYNFNQNSGYELYRPLYLVGIPQTGGGFKLDNSNSTSYYTQNLPTNEDGKIYIQLGIVYAQNSLRLVNANPIYEFKNGAIRRFTAKHKHTIDDIIGGGLGGANNVVLRVANIDNITTAEKTLIAQQLGNILHNSGFRLDPSKYSTIILKSGLSDNSANLLSCVGVEYFQDVNNAIFLHFVDIKLDYTIKGDWHTQITQQINTNKRVILTYDELNQVNIDRVDKLGKSDLSITLIEANTSEFSVGPIGSGSSIEIPPDTYYHATFMFIPNSFGDDNTFECSYGSYGNLYFNPGNMWIYGGSFLMDYLSRMQHIGYYTGGSGYLEGSGQEYTTFKVEEVMGYNFNVYMLGEPLVYDY